MADQRKYHPFKTKYPFRYKGNRKRPDFTVNRHMFRRGYKEGVIASQSCFPQKALVENIEQVVNYTSSIQA